MAQQQQNEKAFTDLIQHNERLIYKVCCIYAADTEDQKDLFQEIVLQAWRAFPSYKEVAKITTWLYRIALNTAISHIRKQGRTIKTTQYDGLLQHAADSITDAYAEEYRVLYKMISDLPQLEKALVLLYLEDKSYQEIGDILGLSPSNVATKLTRIKDKLRKQAEPLLN